MHERERQRLIEEFFDGVDQTRAYLDRHIQDPERRRERLRRVIGELSRKLSDPALGAWWVRAVGEALGAHGGALRLGASWRFRWGEPEPLPRAAVHEGVLVDLSGDIALWLNGAAPLDEGSTKLLVAMGETVVVVLEPH